MLSGSRAVDWAALPLPGRGRNLPRGTDRSDSKKGRELDTEDRIGFTWAEVIGDRLGRVFIGTARTLLADERL